MFTAAQSSSSSLTFLLLLSSLLLTTSKQHHLVCHKEDLSALLKIKKSFGNPSLLSSWNASTSTPCCDWASVYCEADGGGRVTVFNLQYTDIAAAIPHAIGRLSGLRSLLIIGNSNLTGTIPPSIGKLKNLTFLRVSENPLLTGPIPKSICRLPKLEVLDLSQNNLNGEIPGCLGQNLSDVNLAINRLSGPIPASFLRGSTASSVRLNLYSNRLTGAIPKSLGDVPFEFIDVSHNRLSDASVLFGEEKKVKTMYMENNELEFDFSKVSFPLGLESFTVDHNRLTGSIPRQITKLEQIGQFVVSYNYLCGPIPNGKYLKRLDRSSFVHNKCLCGSPLKPCRH